MEDEKGKGKEESVVGENRSAWANPEGLAERIKRIEGNRKKMAEGAYEALLHRRSREEAPREVPAEKVEGKIKIEVPKEILERNARHWEFGLVGRFTGPRPELEKIRLWAAQRWKLLNLEIVALPRGCVLFNFQNKEDMLGVLLKAPWYMEGQGLLLEKWHEGFNPKDEESKLIPVWVQVPGLPLQAWDEDVIRGIAGAIGKLVAIDTATKNKTRLIHARFCVLVRSDETIPSQVELKMGENLWDQELVYEESRMKCSKCRRGYHIPQKCPGKVEEEKKGEQKMKWVPKRKEQETKEKGEESREEEPEKTGEPVAAEAGIEVEEDQEELREETATAGEGTERAEEVEQREEEKEQMAEHTSEEEAEEETTASTGEEAGEFERVQPRRSRRRQEVGKMDIGSEEKRLGRPTDKERREKEAVSQIGMGLQKTLESVRGRGKPRK